MTAVNALKSFKRIGLKTSYVKVLHNSDPEKDQEFYNLNVPFNIPVPDYENIQEQLTLNIRRQQHVIELQARCTELLLENRQLKRRLEEIENGFI